ncbi:uncharacterized protein [Prorops nasuta]|uniref:uncharacterized protein n=1 Tax=Prorops nasuta TaxID=863751 RepID=UPI0034CD0824
MSKTEDVFELMALVSTLQGEFSRFLTNIKKRGVKNFTVPFLEERLATIGKRLTELHITHAKICAAFKSADFSKSEYVIRGTYDLALDAFDVAESYILEQLENLRCSEAAGPKASAADVSNIRLPIIDLPKFSGDYSEWSTFFETFRSIVHDNPALPGVQKFHYLKASLKGEAASIIQSLAVTSENYAVAWGILVSRYTNKRLITATFLNRITQVSVAHGDNLNSLKTIRDSVAVALDALKAMGYSVDRWDPLIVHILTNKLDNSLRLEWEKLLGSSTDYPTYAQFLEFLSCHINTLESIGVKPKTSRRESEKTFKSHTAGVDKTNCVHCGSNHLIYQCKDFLALSPNARSKFALSQNLCINCLRPGHSCTSCNSSSRCRKCNKLHHTLLHFERLGTGGSKPKETTPSSRTAVDPEPSCSNAVSHLSITDTRSVLLATFSARIETNDGSHVLVRGLVDPGSETSFITENLAQQIHVKRKRIAATIYGVTGDSAHTVRAETELKLHSIARRGLSLDVTALILPKITSYTPPTYSPSMFPQLRELELADNFAATKAPIDILLGADYFPALIEGPVIRSPDRSLVAQKTIFGWLVSGVLPSPVRHSALTVHHCSGLEKTLRDFWELEEVPEVKSVSTEDSLCEQHFVNTFSRTPSGRFVVALPFRSEESKLSLGSSSRAAEKTLSRILRKLERSPSQEDSYSQFLREYQSLGHMSPINLDSGFRVFLPHHAVFKIENQKEKIRVVFNASSKTSSGVSLNDTLFIGPKLQQDITRILMNWRAFRHVGVTDIVKMFRQILVRSEDRKYQNILWKTESGGIQAFELNTVTYGTGPAPFLSSRVLRELAFCDGRDFPLAQNVLLNSTYVDDILFGAHDTEQLEATQDQLIRLLAKGGFSLSKWAFSESRSSVNEPSEPRVFSEDPSDSGKILGIAWDHVHDHFRFFVSPSSILVLTKRVLLSENAQIYDPLGWISPVTVVLKQLMQSTWLLKLAWDDEIPDPIRSKWLACYDQLQDLRTLRISRWTGQTLTTIKRELLEFCDASELAYGAVVYERITASNGQISVHLVMSKTKVAPIKTTSIPRLELVAAALLTKLILHVKRSLTGDLDSITCYSDSQVTLAWLAKQPVNWKTFVANRVSLIQTQLPNAKWHYVNTKLNPADLCSRGISAKQLTEDSLWWQGPAFLREQPTHDIQVYETSEESRKTNLNVHVGVDQCWFLDKYSSWHKLVRVMAYVIRFVNHARKQSTHSDLAFSVSEVRFSVETLVKVVQRAQFAKELAALQQGERVPTRSKLLPLYPTLDSRGILRVGGRLRNANLSEHAKHPIVLPECHLASILIRQTYLDTLHGGLQLTLATLRQKFWIINARNLVKSVVHKCTSCVRERAKLGVQLMGSLPAARVSRSFAFENTGVDYAGPFSIKLHHGRNAKSVKGYVAVFVCLATRAIHLELVSRLDTEAFLAALARFISRRGKPAAIYSDNGLNFQGADAELTRAFKSSLEIARSQDTEPISEIEWKFIPVATPHWGGLWESAVKSMKHHLKRSIGVFVPNFEEMTTLLSRIEACLNSRPISRMHDDLESLDVLTPGHFLIGRPLLAPPEFATLDLRESTLNRWQSVTKISEVFWKKWSSEYLHTLQNRPKWQNANMDFQVGDIVLVKVPNNPPRTWTWGRILKLISGVDGLARVATIKTAKKEIQRSVSQLCKLPS